MEILLSLVTIASAVLNIILFFKVWGMTNNVSELKKYFVDSEKPIVDNVVFMSLINNPTKAEEYLIECMNTALAIEGAKNIEYGILYRIEEIKEKRKKFEIILANYYCRLGKEMPSNIMNDDYILDFIVGDTSKQKAEIEKEKECAKLFSIGETVLCSGSDLVIQEILSDGRIKAKNNFGSIHIYKASMLNKKA